jgi:hypothetical protein
MTFIIKYIENLEPRQVSIETLRCELYLFYNKNYMLSQFFSRILNIHSRL